MDGFLDHEKQRLRVVSAASRRFPTPWRVRELCEAFVVEDANGTPIAYTYFDTNRMPSASTSDKLTQDEARQVAANIANLPELGGKGKAG
jgi:hypothetical protein